jgi:hypothetical protein
MYDSEELKVLCGNTIELDEMDYDDDAVESETGDPAIDSGLMQYYFVNVVDYMGTPEFKSNYQAVIGDIRKYSTKQQQLLANAIVDALPKKYDFEFSIKFDFNNKDEINELYKFVEFVEYDHEKFIVNVWKYLNPDTNSFQVEIFCEHNIPNIIREIEDQLEIRDYSELIADFLRTYNKEKLIEWFCEKSVNLRSSILITLLRKE